MVSWDYPSGRRMVFLKTNYSPFEVTGMRFVRLKLLIQKMNQAVASIIPLLGKPAKLLTVSEYDLSSLEFSHGVHWLRRVFYFSLTKKILCHLALKLRTRKLKKDAKFDLESDQNKSSDLINGNVS